MCAAGNEPPILISNVRGPISSSSTVSKLKKVGENQFRLDTLTTGLGIVFAPRIRWMAMSRFLARKRNLLESFNPKEGGTYVNNFDHHSHSVARRRITELAL